MTVEIKLSELRIKEKAKVKKLSVDPSLRKKLLDMGMTPGVVVEVVKIAPMGDPIDIKVRGYHLSLRKNEAEQVLVGCEL